MKEKKPMTHQRQNRAKLAGLIFLILVSTLFLMGDFCEDVLSVPIKVTYESEPKEFIVQFYETTLDEVTDTDGDIDFDIEEIPEYDGQDIDADYIAPSEQADLFKLTPQHVNVDFDDAQGGSAAKKYKNNLVGIFIRDVSYLFQENNIPADIPPLDIYVTTTIQCSDESGDGDYYCDDGQPHDNVFPWEAASKGKDLDWRVKDEDCFIDGTGDENPDCIWTSAADTLAEGEVACDFWASLLVCNERFGNVQLINPVTDDEISVELVKMGSTEAYHWMEEEDAQEPKLKSLQRETTNLDRISSVIMHDFNFEVLIVPRENIEKPKFLDACIGADDDDKTNDIEALNCCLNDDCCDIAPQCCFESAQSEPECIELARLKALPEKDDDTKTIDITGRLEIALDFTIVVIGKVD